MTRAEHLAWAKERALEYMDRGDMNGAIGSMTSDLGKHEETRFAPRRLDGVLATSEAELRAWIEGFE